MLLLRRLSRRLILTLIHCREVTRLSICVELPDVDTVIFCGTDDLVLVTRIEDNVWNSVSMADKCLIEIGNSSISFIVPRFNQRIIATGHHKPAIKRQIGWVDWSSVHILQLAQQIALELVQTENFNLLVSSDHDRLGSILVELE